MSNTIYKCCLNIKLFISYQKISLKKYLRVHKCFNASGTPGVAKSAAGTLNDVVDAEALKNKYTEIRNHKEFVAVTIIC